MVAAPAQAAVVDFENLSAGTVYQSLSYDNVTFTNATNRFTVVETAGNARICSSNQISCLVPLLVSFDQAVQGLTFDVTGVNRASSAVGNALISFGDGTTTNFALSGQSTGVGYNRQDLSAFTNISSVLLTTADPLGLSYDNFSFQVSNAVPEPATWAMMIGGFGLVGAAMRRRQRVAYAAG